MQWKEWLDEGGSAEEFGVGFRAWASPVENYVKGTEGHSEQSQLLGIGLQSLAISEFVPDWPVFASWSIGQSSSSLGRQQKDEALQTYTYLWGYVLKNSVCYFRNCYIVLAVCWWFSSSRILVSFPLASVVCCRPTVIVYKNTTCWNYN